MKKKRAPHPRRAKNASRPMTFWAAMIAAAFLLAVSLSSGAEIDFPSGWGVQGAPDPTREGERILMQEVGIQWIRVPLVWSETEREPGVYDFSKYAELAHHWRGHSAGRILFVLGGGNDLYASLELGSAGPGPSSITPRAIDQRQAFIRWAVAAVNRFRGDGIIWQIWDEPNLPGNWHPAPNAAEYAAFAREAAAAIKSSAPGEIVVPLSLGCDGGEPGLCEPSDWQFAETCFRNGLLDYADAVSLQFYPFNGVPERADQDYRSMRTLLNQYDPTSCKRVKIISGKTAYPSVPTPSVPQADELKQAKIWVRQLLVNGLNEIPLSLWYHWRDVSLTERPGPEDWPHRSGLVKLPFRPGGTPVYELKQSFQAIRLLIDFLGGYQLDRRLEVGGASHYAVRFTNGPAIRYVAWTSQPTPQNITIPGIPPGTPFRVSHFSDANSQVMIAGQNGLALVVTDGPVFIDAVSNPPENSAPRITAGPVAAPNPAVVGQPVTLTVTASDPDGDPLTYSWNFGDGKTGQGRQVSHTYGSAQNFTAVVAVSDGRAGRVTTNVTVQVLPTPPAPPPSPPSDSLRDSGRSFRAQPNPFNPDRETLAFQGMPEGARIRIYDRKGRFVRDLKGAPVWDGKNEDGEPVPSGLYLGSTDKQPSVTIAVTH